MKKVKTENQSDTFFDSEKTDENKSLRFVGNAEILKLEDNPADEPKSFHNVLKQIFLFLPGAFLLFYTSFAAAMIAAEIVVFRRPAANLPDDYPLQFALIGAVIILGTLMTWFGLGDLKNRKHFVIPASIFITGATLGAIIRTAAKISDFFDRMLDDFNFLIYLFPLALIVPVLAKSWVENKKKDFD